jgi:hypothetical protein
MDCGGYETVELLFIGFPEGTAPPESRAVFRRSPGQTVKHLAEKAGVPHTEIGPVEAGGVPVSLSYIPRPGEKVSLFPVDRFRRSENAAAFLLDVHLGRLARFLRLLGFDAAYRNDMDDDSIIRTALQDGRTILTRDRGLLMRRAVRNGYLVRGGDPFLQLVAVLRDFGLERKLRPFSRCARCGGPIVPVEKARIAAELPELVRRRYRRFFQCPACGGLYWKGDHFRNIEPFMRRLRTALGGRGL